MKLAEKKLGDTARNFNKIGDSFLKVAAPLAALGGASFKMAMDFDTSMRKVQAISGATGEDFDQLRKMALKMGNETKFSAEESAQAMTYMAMAGWKTTDIMSGLPGVLSLAAASGEDLATVADIVTDGMTAFGLAADQSGRFADVLAAAASNSNTNVGMMGDTFRYVAPLAGAMGFSIEDTAVAIGLMANAGIKGSQAGTALRSMVSRLAKPTRETQKAMNDLGISITDTEGQMKPLNQIIEELRGKFSNLTPAQQAQYAASIAGQEAMSGMLAMINAGQDDFDKLTVAINNSAGKADEMASIMNSGIGGAFIEMKSAITTAMITLGDSFVPVVSDAVAKIKELANWFTELDQETKDNIVSFTLWAVKIGVFFKVLATGFKIAQGAVAAFNAVLALNPIGLIVAGIVATILAIREVVLGYEKWGAAVTLLFGPIGMLLNIIMSVRRHWDSVKAAFTTDGIIGGLKRLGLVLLDSLLMPIQQLLSLASKIPGIGDLAAGAMEKIEGLRKRLNLTADAVRQTGKSLTESTAEFYKLLDVKKPIVVKNKAVIETDLSSLGNEQGGSKKETKPQDIERALVVPLQKLDYVGLWSQKVLDTFSRSFDKGQFSTAVESMTASTDPLIENMIAMNEKAEQWKANQAEMAENNYTLAESFEKMTADLQNATMTGNLFEATMAGMAQGVAEAAMRGASDFKTLAAAALDSGSKIIRSSIMQGVASYVSSALTKVPFPFGAIAGTVAGAAAVTLFNGLLNKVTAPKLAKGGLAYGETLATVGDNAFANVNPEVIAPLSDLKDIIVDALGMRKSSESGMSGRLTSRVQGRDFWVMLERSRLSYERTA